MGKFKKKFFETTMFILLLSFQITSEHSLIYGALDKKVPLIKKRKKYTFDQSVILLSCYIALLN